MSHDWYQRNPADFLDGVASMPLELVGAYTVLLDTMYLLGRPLHDDDSYIAGLLRVTTRKWRAIRKELLERGKIFVADGKIDNVRVEFERKKSANLSRTRVDSGRRGGETKAASNKNNDLALAKFESATPRREEKREEPPIAPQGGEGGTKVRSRRRPSLPESDLDASFSSFKAGYPERIGDYNWKTARQRLGSALRSGVRLEDVLRGLAGYRADLERQGKIGTAFVKQASVFLSQETWREYADAGPQGGGLADPMMWLARLEAARKRKQWATTKWGPMPGQPGCLVPAELLLEGDGIGWTEWRVAA